MNLTGYDKPHIGYWTKYNTLKWQALQILHESWYVFYRAFIHDLPGSAPNLYGYFLSLTNRYTLPIQTWFLVSQSEAIEVQTWILRDPHQDPLLFSVYFSSLVTQPAWENWWNVWNVLLIPCSFTKIPTDIWGLTTAPLCKHLLPIYNVRGNMKLLQRYQCLEIFIDG